VLASRGHEIERGAGVAAAERTLDGES